jgi:hypothetical protein
MVADVVLSQMLPPCAVKGGSAVVIRLGVGRSRFTEDVDVGLLSGSSEVRYLDLLDENLARGWSGFSGALVPFRAPANAEKLAQPRLYRARIRLSYRGRHWVSVMFELSKDEVVDQADTEATVSDDIVELFAVLGIDSPRPVALLSRAQQVAQKIHACTMRHGTTRNDRAHDLVDLQLLLDENPMDLGRLRQACVQLFQLRAEHEWPPVVRAEPTWDALYGRASHGLPVRREMNDAVRWANDLIARIDDAQIDGAGGDSRVTPPA